MAVNVITRSNLANDFTVDTPNGIVYNDTIIQGTVAPTANPPVLPKKWLFYNTVLQKITHEWNGSAWTLLQEITTTVAGLRAKTTNYLPEYWINDLGKEGWFKQDLVDTTTADNLGTVLVTANGVRYKRVDKIYHVRYFGAAGNGSTDDTTAIQNAANASGGKELLFDNLVYAISNTIDLVANTTVRGNGCTLKVLSDLPTRIVLTHNVKPGILLHNDCVVDKVKVDGNNKVCDGFCVVGKNNVTVQFCEAFHYNAQFAIADFACTNVNFLYNKIYEAPLFGIHSFISDGVRVIGNKVSTTTSGFYSGYSKNVFVSLNELEHCGDVQLDFEGGYNCISDNNIVSSYRVGGCTIYSGNGAVGYTPSHLIHKNNHLYQTATFNKWVITSGVGALVTGTTVAADNAGLRIYSYASGQNNCGFHNNTVHMEASSGTGMSGPQLGGAKTGANAFFTNNKIYSKGSMFSFIDFENLKVVNNHFYGLPGSETIQNQFREQHNGLFENNTFEYTNAKTTNHAVLFNTGTGWATVPALMKNNKFINAEGFCIQVNGFARGTGWLAKLDGNEVGTTFTTTSGIDVTANGGVFMIRQTVRLDVPMNVMYDVHSPNCMVGARIGNACAKGWVHLHKVGVSTGSSAIIHSSNSVGIAIVSVLTAGALTIAVTSNHLVLTAPDTTYKGRLEMTIESNT